ncbi:uncharacterized protein LOC108032324 isoform X2 [Drosophila biarmipes]|uniref:uncharacterized protein LOC108032324 isoform X2 n=1 Tax=Drosophila biarmipes TaxID=125945 RepID=UPI0021CCCED3|nr:uncharacterized protein LOC108032324 isoform X2 [Drosophila biarmipes]
MIHQTKDKVSSIKRLGNLRMPSINFTARGIYYAIFGSRLVPTYILPAIERRLLGKFQLIKNLHTLWAVLVNNKKS